MYLKMTTEKAVAHVTAALAEGSFPTKVAQKDAQEYLSSAFNAETRKINDVLRIMRVEGDPDWQPMTPEALEVSHAMPYSLANWRPKHSQAVLRLLPGMAGPVANIDQLFELRAKVAAMPIAPKSPTKREQEEKIRLTATGKVYDQEFSKMKPALAADFRKWVEADFERLASKWGDKAHLLGEHYRSPKYWPEGATEWDFEVYQRVARYLTDSSRRGGRPQLDGGRLAKEADAYAKDQVAAFVIKLTQKLGDLADLRIVRANGHRFECDITGKLGAREIRVRQTAKFVVNQNGTAFHQFPALIYVDGKFTTESAYKRLAQAGA